MNGRKYQAYSSFLKNNADSMRYVRERDNSYRWEVTYAPKGVSLFSKIDNGYEVEYIWNPEITWQEKSFFSIESGEREWTSNEKKRLGKSLGRLCLED